MKIVNIHIPHTPGVEHDLHLISPFDYMPLCFTTTYGNYFKVYYENIQICEYIWVYGVIPDLAIPLYLPFNSKFSIKTGGGIEVNLQIFFLSKKEAEHLSPFINRFRIKAETGINVDPGQTVVKFINKNKNKKYLLLYIIDCLVQEEYKEHRYEILYNNESIADFYVPGNYYTWPGWRAEIPYFLTLYPEDRILLHNLGAYSVETDFKFVMLEYNLDESIPSREEIEDILGPFFPNPSVLLPELPHFELTGRPRIPSPIPEIPKLPIEEIIILREPLRDYVPPYPVRPEALKNPSLPLPDKVPADTSVIYKYPEDPAPLKPYRDYEKPSVIICPSPRGIVKIHGDSKGRARTTQAAIQYKSGKVEKTDATTTDIEFPWETKRISFYAKALAWEIKVLTLYDWLIGKTLDDADIIYLDERQVFTKEVEAKAIRVRCPDATSSTPGVLYYDADI